MVGFGVHRAERRVGVEGGDFYDASGFDVSQLVRLCLRGEQHTQRQCDFVVLLRIVFPLNPCFVLWTSRSHKLPVGGKEEKNSYL